MARCSLLMGAQFDAVSIVHLLGQWFSQLISMARFSEF